jgi:hypothetical protein
MKKEYKLTILYNGKRYAVMAHTVERDESIYVRSRKRKDTLLINSGVLVTSEITRIEKQMPTRTVGNQLHYHPTGYISRKENSTLLKIDKLYPLINLPEPIALFKISPAKIEWFDEARNKKDEIFFDLTTIESKFSRLDFQIWIGPKGSIKDGFRPPNTYASILFEDGILYDVAYFIREMDVLENDLNQLTLTAFPETDILYDKSLPPEPWVGGLAIAKQVRLFLSEFIELNHNAPNDPEAVPKLFDSGHHIRMSICRDGVIAGVGQRTNGDMGSMEWKHFDLTTDQVLQMLINRPYEDKFIDVGKLNKTILPERTVYLRTTHPIRDSMKHELIVIAKERKNGYYQLPYDFNKNVRSIRAMWIKEILSLNE